MPKVSVIIPAYNCSNYICEAIDSVLNQTFKDYEIIVVNDGSTDNIEELLLKYNGKIKYFYQENKGVSAARNLGIKEAMGNYIAFLDNDDIWFPDKLRLQVEIMDSNPEVAMIFTDGESFDKKGLIRISLRPTKIPEFQSDNSSFKYKMSQASFSDGSQFKGNFYKDLLMGNLIAASSTLINKKRLEEIGYFDNNLPINQDYNLWIRIAKIYTLLYLNKVTVRYRIRDDSVSGGREIRAYVYREYDAKMLERFIKDCPKEYEDLIKKRIYECYRVAAWWHLTHNDLKKVRRLCIQSLAYNKFQIKLYLYIIISFLPVKSIFVFRKLKLNLCQAQKSA